MDERVNEQALKSHTDRRQLHQIIAGLTEGVILIEPDQRIVWANEAALAMHGVTELAELGADVTEYRALPAALPEQSSGASRPLSDGPRDRGRAVQRRDRRSRIGRRRERELGPPDPQPRVDECGRRARCLALVLHDATEWASAEDRFERTFNTNPAPAAICRLDDLRYVKVNQGFLDMTGYARDEVLGRSVYEVDVLEQAERRELAIERLAERATIPQMEAVVKRADGSPNAVVVAGQPIDMNGEACMLFTFMDLEPRRQAELALRQSEERFAKAFRMAPVATAIVTADGFVLLDVNDAFVAMTGHPRDDLLGKSADEIGLWAERGAREQLDGQLARDGGVRNADVQIRTREGDLRDCVVSADPVAIHGQDCVLIALLDISDRKRTEMELVYAIETAMQDASWFSRTLIEARERAARECAGRGAAAVGSHRARARRVRSAVSGPRRQGDRRPPRPRAEHGPQSRRDDLRETRRAQPRRGHRMGARARRRRRGRSERRAHRQGRRLTPSRMRSVRMHQPR
jgi:PAS domain S-box-containing protein